MEDLQLRNVPSVALYFSGSCTVLSGKGSSCEIKSGQIDIVCVRKTTLKAKEGELKPPSMDSLQLSLINRFSRWTDRRVKDASETSLGLDVIARRSEISRVHKIVGVGGRLNLPRVPPQRDRC